MDIAIALLPSLLFGSTGLLIMKLGGDPRQQSMGQFIGGFLVAAVALPFFGVLSTWQENLLAFATGAILSLGLVLQVRTFHTIGVGRTMPISTGGQIITISLLGIFLLGEWRGAQSLPIGLTGLAVVIAGVAATCWTEKDAEKKVSWRGNIWMLVVSVLALSIYLVILRYYNIDPNQSVFPIACGFMVCGFVLTSPHFTPHLGLVDTRKSKYTARQILAGVVWGLGIVVMVYSSANVGVATGFTLSQMGVAISTIGAVTLLGETRTPKEWLVMSVGIVLLIAGTVLVGTAKALDV